VFSKDFNTNCLTYTHSIRFCTIAVLVNSYLFACLPFGHVSYHIGFFNTFRFTLKHFNFQAWIQFSVTKICFRRDILYGWTLISPQCNGSEYKGKNPVDGNKKPCTWANTLHEIGTTQYLILYTFASLLVESITFR